MTELDKIDVIRRRTGVSYAKAREALEQANGNVVDALVLLEAEAEDGGIRERIEVRGADLVDRVKELIREGTVRRIIIRNKDRTLLEIPVAVGAAAALFLPTLTALGVLAAWLTEASIVVERRESYD